MRAYSLALRTYANLLQCQDAVADYLEMATAVDAQQGDTATACPGGVTEAMAVIGVIIGGSSDLMGGCFAKVHKVVGLHNGMPTDAAFARQLRRRFVQSTAAHINE